MIHTQLLEGSLSSDLNMTPAQRRKALAGRIEEVAGSSKIGKGEQSIRKLEHNRSSKKIRDSIKARKDKIIAAKLAEVLLCLPSIILSNDNLVKRAWQLPSKNSGERSFWESGPACQTTQRPWGGSGQI